jgi:hypothetical protein
MEAEILFYFLRLFQFAQGNIQKIKKIVADSPTLRLCEGARHNYSQQIKLIQ